MSYYEDLTNYSYLHKENSKNVGWLDVAHPYTKGKLGSEFADKLWLYLGVTLMKARGFHVCNFCYVNRDKVYVADHIDEQIRLGFSEIRVISASGDTIFAAPDLIFHYICKHNYLPPKGFVQAVLHGSKPGCLEYENFLKNFEQTYDPSMKYYSSKITKKGSYRVSD